MLKITAIGNLTNDVTLKTNETTGKPYAILRIASDRRYKDKDGNKLTDFISVKVRGPLAERCAEFAWKGCKLAASGDFETITFEDEPERQPGFLIKASEVEFLSPRKVLSLVMILTVYSRFFKLYIATAIAPIPLASFAGQPSSSIGVAFLKSYAAICLEGCVIVLACVIFSAFASSPPAIADDTLAAATIVWNYVGELIFNMLVLVGAIKMSDRIIRELMGLG